MKLKVKSKMGKIKYKNLKIQKYLTTKKITSKNKKLLFKLRCGMVNVGRNFGRNGNCQLCKSEEDSQQHLIECEKIKEINKEIKENTKVKHDDIYSKSIKKKISAVKLFSKAISVRNQLLERLELL